MADIWDLLGDAVRLQGEANLDAWSVDIARRLETAGLGRFLDSAATDAVPLASSSSSSLSSPSYSSSTALAQWHTDRTQAKMALLVTTAPVSEQLAAAGYQPDNDAFESPRYLYDFVRTRVFLSAAADPAVGRRLLRSLAGLRLRMYDDRVAAFVQAFDDLCARLDRHGAPQTDAAKIWTCLNALEETDPDWPSQWMGEEEAEQAETDAGDAVSVEAEDRLPDKNAQVTTLPTCVADWEAYTSWAAFRHDLVHGFGERKLARVPMTPTSPVLDDWVHVDSFLEEEDGDDGEEFVVEEGKVAKEVVRKPVSKRSAKVEETHSVALPSSIPSVVQRESTPGETTPRKKKRPRSRLKDAKKKHQRSFFHAKFPGSPKCESCRCPHPPKGYDYCSNCTFCHKGGEAVCYDQHPDMREVLLAERVAVREASGAGGAKKKDAEDEESSARKSKKARKGAKKGAKKGTQKSSPDTQTQNEDVGSDENTDSGDNLKQEKTDEDVPASADELRSALESLAIEK